MMLAISRRFSSYAKSHRHSMSAYLQPVALTHLHLPIQHPGQEMKSRMTTIKETTLDYTFRNIMSAYYYTGSSVGDAMKLVWRSGNEMVDCYQALMLAYTQ
jgi:hypothetical protein